VTLPYPTDPTGARLPTQTDSVTKAQPGIAAVGVMLAIQWVSEIIDSVSSHGLDKYGVRPHHLVGLRGIPFAPFLHASFRHLIGNSIPFAVLGVLIALSGLAELLSVTVVVTLISGLGMWVFGSPNQVHIGASGVVFGYLAFLLVRGVFAKNVRQIILGVIVAMVYGGLLWGVLPTARGVSWQGHLFGVVGGVAAAKLLSGRAKSVT
jgi:membrane associated rhomboid family serine protease